MHLGRLVTALADGELDADTRDRVLAHLAGCDACRADAEQERRAKSVLAGAPVPGPSPDFATRLRSLASPPAEPPATGPSTAPSSTTDSGGTAGPASRPGRPRLLALATRAGTDATGGGRERPDGQDLPRPGAGAGTTRPSDPRRGRVPRGGGGTPRPAPTRPAAPGPARARSRRARLGGVLSGGVVCTLGLALGGALLLGSPTARPGVPGAPPAGSPTTRPARVTVPYADPALDTVQVSVNVAGYRGMLATPTLAPVVVGGANRR